MSNGLENKIELNRKKMLVSAIDYNISPHLGRDSAYELLAASLNACGEAVYIVDEEFRIVYANSLFEKISWIINPASSEIIGKKIYEIWTVINENVIEDYKHIFDSGTEKSHKSQFTINSNIYHTEIKRTPVYSAGKAYIINNLKDITESKINQIVLEHSESNLSAVFDNSSVGMAFYDCYGKFTASNSKLNELLGYSELDLCKLSIFDISDEYDRKENIEIIYGIFNGYAKSFKSDRRLKKKTGEKVWCKISVSPIKNRQGKIESILAVIIDINEAKTAEEMLTKSEFEKNLILDALQEQVIYQDLENNIIWVNRAAEKTMKQPNNDWNGKKCFDVFECSDVNCSECPVELTKITGKTHTNSIIKASGEYFTAQTVPVKDDAGNITGIVEVITDLSQIKKAEEETNQSKELLQQIMDLVPHAIFAKNNDGEFLMVNKKMAEYYGKSKIDIIGKKQSDFHHTQCQIAEYYQEDKDIIEKGYSVENKEEMFNDYNGNNINLLTTKIPFRIKGSEQPAVLGVAVDISNAKGLEKQLIQAQKMEAVARLAGGLAHDINNIMTAVIGNSEIIGLDGIEFDEILSRAEYIKYAAMKAGALTRQMLTFSRKQISSPKVIDLNYVIQDTEKMLSRLLGANVTLNFNLSKDLLNIVADPGQIEQVLLNLIVNAKDAISSNGEIIVTTKNIIDNQNNFVCISVKDNGTGIDPAVIDNIFEPFFTTKSIGKGTGLGLSVVYGIIKDHNAKIEVKSNLGEGTEFLILFPATNEIAENILDEKLIMSDYYGKGEKILIVESEKNVRDVLADSLKLMGYEVFVCKKSKKALEIFEEENNLIDYAIIDAVLSDKSGVDLADDLRQLNKNLKVFIASGYSHEKSQYNRIIESGYHFIQKPYEHSRLFKLIKNI